MKKRRLEREHEREQREQDQEMMQRDKELDYFREWEKQEDSVYCRYYYFQSIMKSVMQAKGFCY